MRNDRIFEFMGMTEYQLAQYMDERQILIQRACDMAYNSVTPMSLEDAIAILEGNVCTECGKPNTGPWGHGHYIRTSTTPSAKEE